MQSRTDAEEQGYLKLSDDDTVIETDAFRVLLSGEYRVIGNRYLPTWFEFESNGYDAPNTWTRVELDDEGVPRVVELGWRVRDHQREVRQSDLRETHVSSIIDVLYAGFIIEVREHEGIANLGGPGSEQQVAIQDFLEELRSPGKRRVTGDFLREVADVYRTNIDHAPTQAVARTYGVKLRQAGDYVKKARDRGFLPPTKQGRAKA